MPPELETFTARCMAATDAGDGGSRVQMRKGLGVSAKV